MSKNCHFDEEFRKIDHLIALDMHREAGASCGWVLEYMLLKIAKRLRGEANQELSIALNILIEELGGELDKWDLRSLIRFFNSNDPSKKQSSNRNNRKPATVLSVACRVLNANCKQSLGINLNHLCTIRNNCCHPYKDYPEPNDIKIYKDSLSKLSTEFEKTFAIENRSSLTPIKFEGEAKKKDRFDFMLLILFIISVAIIAINFYIITAIT
jgi:hypothetical protein